MADDAPAILVGGLLGEALVDATEVLANEKKVQIPQCLWTERGGLGKAVPGGHRYELEKQVEAAAKVVDIAAAAGARQDRATSREDVLTEPGDLFGQCGAHALLGRQPDRAAHLDLH